MHCWVFTLFLWSSLLQWLKFDNSYFVDIKEQRDADLLVLVSCSSGLPALVVASRPPFVQQSMRLDSFSFCVLLSRSHTLRTRCPLQPTDACLFEDDGFRPFAEKYAVDQDAFFSDYVESHLKLSELGVKWAA